MHKKYEMDIKYKINNIKYKFYKSTLISFIKYKINNLSFKRREGQRERKRNCPLVPAPLIGSGASATVQQSSLQPSLALANLLFTERANEPPKPALDQLRSGLKVTALAYARIH